MKGLFDEADQIGGRDPIDAAVDVPQAALTARLGHLLRTRAALGLRPSIAPALVFVPLGAALGPLGLQVLTTTGLAHLDVVVTVALAALGVFVGLALDLRARDDRRLFGAASVEAGATMVIVGAAAYLLIGRWHLPLALGPLVIATALGICAAASSAGAADDQSDPRLAVATRIADLDDVLPIVAGAALLASLRAESVAEATAFTALTAGLGLGAGIAGWLLFERAHGEAERAVFVLGAVLLLGGAAAYLNLSPLFAGLVAGSFWTYAPGRADHVIRHDFRKVQHPLVVLLLLAAGASLQFTPAAMWLCAPYVGFRLTGKIVGGWLAARAAPGVAPADLGSLLLPPGLLGLAFALNLQQVAGAPGGVAILTAVGTGTLIAELLAIVVVPHRGGR
jgi:hypothetical protein